MLSVRHSQFEHFVTRVLDISQVPQKMSQVLTHAPLYCATSSPSTKTLSFPSSSSANASFSASLTVYSLKPLCEAYVLLVKGIDVKARGRADGRAAAVRGFAEAERKRDAGRSTRATTMASGLVKHRMRDDLVGGSRTLLQIWLSVCRGTDHGALEELMVDDGW
jgi:hypothetical protein